MLALAAVLAASAAGLARAEVVNVQLSLNGLSPGGADYNYEGWLVGPGGPPVSTGIFDIENDDGSFDGTFAGVHRPDGHDTFVLTLEPEVDPDAGPSSTRVYAGAVNGDISAAHPAVFGDDFSSAAGAFFLAVPTNPGGDFRNGIWFIDNRGGSPAPGFSLPALPAGWEYEGWIAGPDGPVSTGRFTDPAAADSDGGGPTSGPSPGPPFPGSDFVDPPINLTDGYAAVLSIEPQPDNGPEPFAFKPLVAGIDPAIHTAAFVVQDMSQNLASFGGGSVSVTVPGNVAACDCTSVTVSSKATSVSLSFVDDGTETVACL